MVNKDVFLLTNSDSRKTITIETKINNAETYPKNKLCSLKKVNK